MYIRICAGLFETFQQFTFPFFFTIYSTVQKFEEIFLKSVLFLFSMNAVNLGTVTTFIMLQKMYFK